MALELNGDGLRRAVGPVEGRGTAPIGGAFLERQAEFLRRAVAVARLEKEGAAAGLNLLGRQCLDKQQRLVALDQPGSLPLRCCLG